MYNNYRVNAIVQARMTSSRLPGKVLLPLANKPVLQHIIERLRRSKYIDEVIIACTTNEADEPIIDLCNQLDCKYYRGSEDDVLTRVLEAAKEYKTDIIVEVTADCPAICHTIADLLVENLVEEECDHASNVAERTFPRGLDTQVLWTHTLERVNKEVDNEIDRQHVTTWIYRNPESSVNYDTLNIFQDTFGNMPDIRICLDTEQDYKLLQKVFDMFGNNDFTSVNLMHFFSAFPALANINCMVQQKSYEKELEQCKSIAR